jgi:hypothetical protein
VLKRKSLSGGFSFFLAYFFFLFHKRKKEVRATHGSGDKRNPAPSQSYLLKKQGGELLPPVKNLSPILDVKK